MDTNKDYDVAQVVVYWPKGVAPNCTVTISAIGMSVDGSQQPPNSDSVFRRLRAARAIFSSSTRMEITSTAGISTSIRQARTVRIWTGSLQRVRASSSLEATKTSARKARLMILVKTWAERC